MARLLVIDDDLSKRLARELEGRGRDATTLGNLGLRRLEDPRVLEGLAKLDVPWVFVTGDDYMPWEHRALIAKIKATVATVDGEWDTLCFNHDVTMSQETFRCETVHRWAHFMAEQKAGEVRRYHPWNHDKWKVRKQHVRRKKG